MGKMYLGEQEIMPIETVGGGEVVNPNLVINSNHRVCQRADIMNIYQEATTIKATSFDGWLSDRVKTKTDDDGVQEIIISLIPTPRARLTGFTLKNGKNHIEHFLNKKLVSSKKLTLSFDAWFASDYFSSLAESHLLSVTLGDITQSVQTTLDENDRYTMTFDFTGMSKLVDRIFFTTETGLQDKFLKLTNIKLENGEIATRYDEPDYLTELAKCRQYFYIREKRLMNINTWGTLYLNKVYVSFDFLEPPPMRISSEKVKVTVIGSKLDSKSIIFDDINEYNIAPDMSGLLCSYKYTHPNNVWYWDKERLFATIKPLDTTTIEGHRKKMFVLTYAAEADRVPRVDGEIIPICGLTQGRDNLGIHIIFDAQED